MKSPIAEHSDLVLCATPSEIKYFQAPLASKISQVALVDAARLHRPVPQEQDHQAFAVGGLEIIGTSPEEALSLFLQARYAGRLRFSVGFPQSMPSMPLTDARLRLRIPDGYKSLPAVARGVQSRSAGLSTFQSPIGSTVRSNPPSRFGKLPVRDSLRLSFELFKDHMRVCN